MNSFKTALSFDDVLLVPKFSSVKSRKDISLDSKLGALDFLLPIISSPMDTVTEEKMVYSMSSAGGLGIIHRYNTIDEQVNIVNRSINLGSTMIGAAVGVSEDFEERAYALCDAGVKVICIDIAHGHHQMMKSALSNLKETFGKDICIIAGNVATRQAFEDLSDWGADAVRVGVGGGSICSTRIQTGHGVPTLQSILDCSHSDRNAAIIADGGIKNSGDAAKALAAGADFVMLGSVLAGTDETPGDLIRHAGTGITTQDRKVYRGMASREAQQSWRNRVSSVEGISTTVPAKGPVSNILKDLEWGVRSALSYSGAKNLKEFHHKSEFIRQTPAGFKESSTHIIS